MVELNEESLEKAAQDLAGWLGYDWDGLDDRDISAQFPDWSVNGIGHLSMQGGKPALRKIVAKMFATYVAAEHTAGRAWSTMSEAERARTLVPRSSNDA